MSLDVLKQNLASFIRGVMAPVDYYALYPAKVVQQNATSLLLDVQPDDARVPGMQRVPMRLGIPQATAKVSAGARGLLGFEGGDPAKPYWGPWDTTTLLELKVGGAGAQLVALENLVKAELVALRDSVAALVTKYNGLKSDMGTAMGALATHTHAGVTVGVAVSGVSPTLSSLSSGATASAPAAVGDVKAEKVWVK